MNPILVEIIGNLAMFLDFSGDDICDLQGASRQLEEISFHLRRTTEDQYEFCAAMQDIALSREVPEQRRFLDLFCDNAGLPKGAP